MKLFILDLFFKGWLPYIAIVNIAKITINKDIRLGFSFRGLLVQFIFSLVLMFIFRLSIKLLNKLIQ